jgi:hypothetical protein
MARGIRDLDTFAELGAVIERRRTNTRRSGVDPVAALGPAFQSLKPTCSESNLSCRSRHFLLHAGGRPCILRRAWAGFQSSFDGFAALRWVVVFRTK